MTLQNATIAGTVRHRAEDDLFHYDRARAPKPTECDTGLVGCQSVSTVLGHQPAPKMAPQPGSVARSPSR